MNSQFRILIVDDNQAIHEDIRKVLHVDEGNSSIEQMEQELFATGSHPAPSNDRIFFEIDSAMQGREGLDLVQAAVRANRQYTVAVVDMRMPPGWDGVETIEHLWQEDPNLQVVICTAYTDHSWAEIVDRLKVSDKLLILKKPFDNMELLQIVHALAKKWDLQQEVTARLSDLDSLVAKRTRALEEAHETLKKEVAERERVEAELRLGQKLESIGQLAAGIAHEINTPTQFVGDNTQFLQGAFEDLIVIQNAQKEIVEAARDQSVTPAMLEQLGTVLADADSDYLIEEIPKAIEQSIVGIQRISKIVSAMKVFSHPGSTNKEIINLGDAIESVIEVARNEWKYVADMITDFDPQVPPLPCLPAELNQVFLNLLMNSAHAIKDTINGKSAEKGTITVSTQLRGDRAEIRISDTGTGIPENIRNKIFDPFFTTKEVGKGTGQGLAIAHSIVVDKHGGAMSYETEVGKGSTFIVDLPLQDELVTDEECVA